MTQHPVIELVRELVQRPSVTPDDNGCQEVIARRLRQSGFTIQRLKFDEVDNLWATHGSGKPLLAFAGHTDVVPPGPKERWTYPPFSAHIIEGVMYGRGTADMKGGVAAMVCAIESFVSALPDHEGTVAVLLTSDEEGPAINGIRQVVDHLSGQGVQMDFCLLGEPSSVNQLGDSVKVGRRGSMSGTMIIHGKQGHIAYPQLAENPIHDLGKVIQVLTEESWDKGNEFFPPTSFQIANVQAGDGTSNVIPGQAVLNFNFRYSSELDEVTIQERAGELLDQCDIRYEIEWTGYGKPFITRSGELVDAVKAAIKRHTGLETELSTAGGTSDGRFIAPTGAQVVELGPINASIHKIDEHVDLDDLARLTTLFNDICYRLLKPG